MSCSLCISECWWVGASCSLHRVSRFVYQVVVPKSLAPKELVKVFEGSDREVLPPWDPMVWNIACVGSGYLLIVCSLAGFSGITGRHCLNLFQCSSLCHWLYGFLEFDILYFLVLTYRCFYTHSSPTNLRICLRDLTASVPGEDVNQICLKEQRTFRRWHC